MGSDHLKNEEWINKILKKVENRVLEDEEIRELLTGLLEIHLAKLKLEKNLKKIDDISRLY